MPSAINEMPISLCPSVNCFSTNHLHYPNLHHTHLHSDTRFDSFLLNGFRAALISFACLYHTARVSVAIFVCVTVTIALWRSVTLLGRPVSGRHIKRAHVVSLSGFYAQPAPQQRWGTASTRCPHFPTSSVWTNVVRTRTFSLIWHI